MNFQSKQTKHCCASSSESDGQGEEIMKIQRFHSNPVGNFFSFLCFHSSSSTLAASAVNICRNLMEKALRVKECFCLEFIIHLKQKGGCIVAVTCTLRKL